MWRRRLRDRKALGLIASRITRLAFGHTGDVKAVGDGVSELRVHYGPGYRIYFRRHGETIVILLCGGEKGTQARDIQLAKRLAAEWSD